MWLTKCGSPVKKWGILFDGLRIIYCSKNPWVGCVWWIQNKDWSKNFRKEWAQSINCEMPIFLNLLLFVSQNWRTTCRFVMMDVCQSTIEHDVYFWTDNFIVIENLCYCISWWFRPFFTFLKTITLCSSHLAQS